jgi:chromosome segregation ATPase
MAENPINSAIARATAQAKSKRFEQRESLYDEYKRILKKIGSEGEAALSDSEIDTLQEAMETAGFTHDDAQTHLELMNRIDQQQALVDQIRSREEEAADPSAMREEIDSLEQQIEQLQNRKAGLEQAIANQAQDKRERQQAEQHLQAQRQQLHNSLIPILK